MSKPLLLLGDTLNGWSLQVSASTQLYIGVAVHSETIMGHHHTFFVIQLLPLTLLLAFTR